MPKFVTNTNSYTLKKMYVCSTTKPSYWEYRNEICDQKCTGECPDCQVCADNTHEKISIPGGVVGGPLVVSKTLCKNGCKEGEDCWELTATANKGQAQCPCGCFPSSKSNHGTCGNLVELSSFIAKPTDKGISLNWNTETELDSQGFRIWRAIPDLSHYCGCSGNIDDYTQIQVLDEEGKPVLIPAKGSTTSGFDYAYLDEKAKPGIAYCYALEDVDSKGESKFYFEYVAFTPDGLSTETK
ncbi:MAG: hypothetical protein HC877_17210 [Thioploca sp.]|nr:hypothetical protein [Thioploca sp.]